MKNAALIVKPRGDSLPKTVEYVLGILKKYNINPMIDNETAVRFSLNLPTFSIQDMRRLADFVIVLGGDGTLLYASRVFRLINIPILAFNLGRLGFIMELEMQDFERIISDAVSDRLVLKRRMKITSEIRNGKDIVFEEEALNEVVINKGAPSRMLELSIFIDGSHITRYRSDGVIVSTPTGSTGYTISAGGPIVHPDMDTIIVSPICPHALNIRPIVLPHTSTITIKLESSGVEAFVTYDGQIVRPFRNNQEIIIKKSPVYANIAVKYDRSYYSVLKEKLGWGGELC